MFARVKFTSQMSGLTCLTKAERDILMMSAPAAAPFVIELLKKSGEVSVALFVACWGNAIWTKVGECKRIAPKPQKEAENAGPKGEQPSGSGPAPVGQPFKAYGANAKLYGVKSGSYIQKLSDGSAIVVPKPAKK
jgi:predicted peroxiredoxin